MPSIDERRTVAEELRELAQESALRGDDGVYERVSRVLLGTRVDLLDVVDAHIALSRLAELIDPTEHERTIADNLALIDRNRDLECELSRLKSKLGRVVDMARDLHSDARTLAELFADGVMPADAARECTVKHGISERIMEAIA